MFTFVQCQGGFLLFFFLFSLNTCLEESRFLCHPSIMLDFHLKSTDRVTTFIDFITLWRIYFYIDTSESVKTIGGVSIRQSPVQYPMSSANQSSGKCMHQRRTQTSWGCGTAALWCKRCRAPHRLHTTRRQLPACRCRRPGHKSLR